MKSVDPGILPQSICFSFTPSDLAQKLYFYPTWCGHYYCTDNYFMKRETYPPLLILFIREGELYVEYQNQSFNAQKGDVILLDCSKPHYYHARNGLEFLYMHFDGSNSHEICQHILEINMVDFYQNEGIESMFQSSMRIYHIFEYLLKPPVLQTESETPIEESIHYIRQNYHEPLNLNKLAEIANLSPYYYAHCFKEETGNQIRTFLDNR